jgi:hypothetical protein
MKPSCLRCDAEIQGYLFLLSSFLPYGVENSQVMLECAKCGHIEFLSRNSPLLAGMQALPTYAGDGD